MPTYFPDRVEPKWQQYWLEHKTFRAEDGSSKPKYYILDMFPYPSGQGLHVGHPEGYTATDILARYKRMMGFNVLHPMGWDAFGLPAEQYAVQTNTHPSITTAKNVETFRRQIQRLGFSYDWDREIDTTDPAYYRWTQWIFLQLYHTWYDAEAKTGRPISELPIPFEVLNQGEGAVADYRNQHRLAYIADVPVNWCEALGTVLANEEVINGRSERGDHPVVRLPLRQWMLRITAYAERLIDDLDTLDWSEPIKEMQRNWIGKSEGAEVDFRVLAVGDKPSDLEEWFLAREKSGFPALTDAGTIRVFTTRPDTLFGATYMVLAPEHPLVDSITSPDQRGAVEEYRRKSSAKSDLDRTDLAKDKTGVFTGAYAINPANGAPTPIWIADYVLMGYGTGAIMAVPAHDERDFAFAQKFDLDIIPVVADPEQTPKLLLDAYRWLGEWERWREAGEVDGYLRVALLLNVAFDTESFREDLAEHEGDPLWKYVKLIDDQSGPDRGVALSFLDDDFYTLLSAYFEEDPDSEILVLSFDPEGDAEADEDADDDSPDDAEFEEEEGDESVYTAEGIAIDSGLISGLPTAEAKSVITDWLANRGVARKTINYRLRDWLFSRQRYWGEPFPVVYDENGRHWGVDGPELPILLPELADFKPTGTPEPLLAKAADWIHVERNGKKYRRELNTMPQWAGSCWYYLRFVDPKNEDAPWSADAEQYWMPVDLYVGGAEHAVLHLLYSRFWHKVLFDLGYVHTTEPFQRLVNQGMILGEMEYVGFKKDGEWVDASAVNASDFEGERIKLTEEQVKKAGDRFVLTEQPKIGIVAQSFKMSKSRGNVINPDDVIVDYGADSLRLYEMFMGPLEATKPWSMRGVEGVWRFLNRVWRTIVNVDSEELALVPEITGAQPASRAQLRLLHQTMRGVTQDIEGMRFNTAISKMMEFVNALSRESSRPREIVEPFVLLLAPFAPHMAEELWQTLGHKKTLAYENWPLYDETLCAEDEVEVVLQVNNKVRSKITVPAGITDDELLERAAIDEKLTAALAGRPVVKKFVVSNRTGRLVNFVVKG